MKRALFGAILSSVLLAACGQSDGGANNQAAAAPPVLTAFKAEGMPKPEEMKAWTAKRGKNGDITVKGKAHVKDPRYQAILRPAVISGTSAEISPTIQQNAGYAAPGDWWDVSISIPGSAAVTDVKVTCGANTVADLTVAAKS